jgi:outer membrane receptor protein involved in Fe transport
MMANRNVARAVRMALIAASAASAGLYVPGAAAQDQELEQIVVTGSRIARQDFVANSPLTTVTQEQIVQNQDVTLDTYLNTLPQVNPAGTTTSNNPGNGGQSNINLRGLGSNRNLVLIDGRRPMVSASDQTVDLNTIPSALIESIEVITGGAGAVYGADAVAGAVNIKLKKNFEGVDVRAGYANTGKGDAEERNIAFTAGGNFGDGRGNAVVGFEYSDREGMIKSQRDFAAVATSTTTFLPEGLVSFPSANAPTQAAIDTVFAQYGVAPAAVGRVGQHIGFNLDGTLFARGIFNSPLDVQNWRYPVDLAVNTNLFPDVYSYNFDSVNILVLPLERRSMMGKVDYEWDNGVEVFTQFGLTEYTSFSALAPTPIPTVSTTAPGFNSATQATSPLVTPGINPATGSAYNTGTQLVIPVTNPFIPQDFLTLLNSRTGNSASLVGSGATEPFLMRQRTLDAGLRGNGYENTVWQVLAGARGPLFWEGWTWEAYASEGRTEIDQTQTGNINTQRLLDMLNAADGGASVCEGGFNPFGRQPISAECVQYLQVQSTLSTEFTQDIVQGFISGEVVQLPAGALSVVLGAEYRGFKYDFDPGASGGPVSGFNAQSPAGGRNSFTDYFAEALVPIIPSLELSLGYRSSTAEFKDNITGLESDSSTDDAYKFELSWKALDSLRLRGSYQRAVRAPNFGELFDSTASNPQYFDPCSATSNLRNGPDAAEATALCADAGYNGGVPANYVQTPGTQVQIVIAGNTDLKPETADTYTVGAVFQSPWEGKWTEGFQGSIDYYNIEIEDPILVPNPNLIIADCYNLFGNNPDYDPAYFSCEGIFRAGGDILSVDNLDDPDGYFPGINAGVAATEGIDVQLAYAVDFEDMGRLNLNLLMNFLLSYEQQERDYLPKIDYKGTVSYFGEGLGTSAPEFKANLLAAYTYGPITFDTRARYIDSMDNRASLQYPGEEFTGVPSVTYWDFGLTFDFGDTESALGDTSFRVGVNNAFDKQPPTYAPNVQSGTDPSLYDVIGRRYFAQVNVKF